MKTTHNVPLKALCLTLGVHFKDTHAWKYSNIIWYFARLFVSLHIKSQREWWNRWLTHIPIRWHPAMPTAVCRRCGQRVSHYKSINWTRTVGCCIPNERCESGRDEQARWWPSGVECVNDGQSCWEAALGLAVYPESSCRNLYRSA